MDHIEEKRMYACESLSRFWPQGMKTVVDLPIPCAAKPDPEPLPPNLELISLPEWSTNVAVNGGILVPTQFIVNRKEPLWKQVDWLGTIFWYLNGSAERAYEERHGPIHSYSFWLKGWDPRLWKHAWVNRIAMFLRKWAARKNGLEEESLLGPLPESEIIITHDIDAITKTMAIRFKQAAFHLFNSFRGLVQGRFGIALRKFTKAFRFLLSSSDYWCFDKVLKVETQYGIRSHFNVYGGATGWKRDLRQLFFDPAYDVHNPKLQKKLKELRKGGWNIGLHQSYNAWEDPEMMRTEKARVEQALGAPVTTCRQHWLRFSWERTWKAQQEAGFEMDTTLGFNDRPAFRNGSALQFHPWDFAAHRPMNLSILPMVMMDSHLFDYSSYEEEEQRKQMKYWLEEIKKAHGTATILWHQHAMSDDYGWSRGFKDLLASIEVMRLHHFQPGI